ncbi:FUSC family protein [Streptomyces noursei]|uniref:FUSC family protein n=1 Tax=Streptomyces noursei TaxID=1971 RepID=UPI001966A1FC|nr:FUSC family protein [Streptomyces noursei]QRX90575.1 FUSC family protein [Streptomyces noursei]
MAAALHPRHASWLSPHTACLVFRPDAMPLHHRALHRAAGTIAGILLALGLAALAPHGWTLIALAMTIGALVPALTDWSYTGHTAMATIIVLVLANPTAIGDPRESAARLVGTLLA